MTAPAQTVETKAPATIQAWRPGFIRRAPVRIAVIAICVLWTLPTLGLFITSFRNPLEITTTGWWTVFLHPFRKASGLSKTTPRSSARRACSTPFSRA